MSAHIATGYRIFTNKNQVGQCRDVCNLDRIPQKLYRQITALSALTPHTLPTIFFPLLLPQLPLPMHTYLCFCSQKMPRRYQLICCKLYKVTGMFATVHNLVPAWPVTVSNGATSSAPQTCDAEYYCLLWVVNTEPVMWPRQYSPRPRPR